MFIQMGSLLLGQTSVLTQHNDLSRTGQNLNESILTPASVSSGNFGKVFSLTVDGAVAAQPLFMPGLTVNGSSHNVVFIATEHDSVFAFDADMGGTALWQASLLDSRHGASPGATSVPESQSGCPSPTHEYGVTGTPVIDAVTGTLYVVSDTQENNYPVYRLHALDVNTGAEEYGGPVVISGAIPAAGVGSSNGILNFDTNVENQRAGLALVNGKIYVAFGSLCDFGSYHGWLFEYDSATLAQTSIFVPTPNGIGSGLWMSGAAPAAETVNGATRMFIATGNGSYNATTPYATNTMNYGDDVLRLDLSNGMQVADAFTPWNQSALEPVDADVGSSGPMLLPDQPGNHPHLLVQSSKGGVLYLIDRDNMGGYSASDNVVQELANLAGAWYGLPAYWNGNVYLWPQQLPLQQFSLTNGLLSQTPVAVSTYQPRAGHGATPSISANGNTNGIVWSVDASQSTEVLYAHDATNVAKMLWNSAISAGRDSAGQKLSFVVPTIANGRVYVGSAAGQVAVYGILNIPQTITCCVIATQTAGSTLNPGATASSGLAVTYSSSTPSVCTASGSVVTLVATGTCTLSASQAGNGTYAAAAPISQSFTVNPQAAPPPFVGYVASWGINDTGATISWSTDVNATTQVAYGTTTALGSLSPLQNSLSASHGVVLSTLNPGTTYYFVAQSATASGSIGASTTYSFKTTGTATTPAPVISSATALNISNTSATITWTTDQASSSQVNYGATTAYGSSSTLNTSLVASHSVVLTGLTPGTAYNFAVVSANSSSMSNPSANFTFTTTGTAPSPVILKLATSGITATSVTVTWTTDQASSSLVNYGTTTAYGSSSTLDPGLVTSHSVTLAGLMLGTTYNFAVVSANAGNLSATSSNSTFTTLNSIGPPPFVGYVASWGINQTGATVSWSTDVNATTQLAYGTTTALGSLSPLQTAASASHGVVLTDLNSGTTYYFVAQSTAANGATGYSATFSFKTSGTAAITPPAISAVMAVSITSTSATITWATDQASSSLVNYGTTTAYGSSSTPDTSLVISHSQTLSGLTPGNSYSFDVVSANASGMPSTSPNYSFQTPATGVAMLPAISNVSYANATSNAVTITWTTDQPATSSVNYGTTATYGSSSLVDTSLVTSHSVTLSGLAPGTIYDYDVVSQNATALSATSPTSTFSTAAVSGGVPPFVGYVAFWGVNNSGVIISWSSDVPANTVVAYGTTPALGSFSAVQTALTNSHGVTLSGLNSGTTYYFQAQSTGVNGATGSSTPYSFTTTGVASTPTLIANVAVNGITNTTGVITWTTDQPSSSEVNFGTSTSYGSATPLNATLVTSHAVTVTGLTAATSYDFVVVSANASGITSTSPNTTFQTTNTIATGPAISSVTAINVTAGTAIITWTTELPAPSQVKYGTSAAYGSLTALDPTAVTSHSVSLSGLLPKTLYDFQVVSGTTSSGNYTFTTSAASTRTPPPVVSYVAFWGITGSGVTISWSTNVPANTSTAYGTTTALGQTTVIQTAQTTSHGVTLSGLNPSTTYYFVAQSADASGNIGSSTTYSFTTIAGPPTISGIVVTPATPNSAVISWATSAATYSYVRFGSSSSNYGRYSAQTNRTATPSCSLGYVPSGTVYYQLVSTDGNGNQAFSPEGQFTEP